MGWRVAEDLLKGEERVKDRSFFLVNQTNAE